MNLEQLKAAIARSPELSFGDIFSKSTELFKKVWVQGLVTLLLMMVCMMPFYLIIYVPLMVTGMADPQAFQQEEPPVGMMIGFFLLYPILILGALTISNSLMASFYDICKRKDLDEMGAEQYFKYFKKPHLQKSFVLGLYGLGLSILGMLACGLGMFYVMVPVSLFPVFMAFNQELSAKEIVSASFALGNKNWLTIFGLILVCGFLANLGLILCIVGVYFTAMFAKIPMYYVYKDSLGFTEQGAETASGFISNS
ncbi:hypothetical protein [Croceivirga radicis]|uniref:hypothetical protein n=1 Tax=Croceivirga radicis TaxID=1929488 RepID=UPI000255B3CE|nr:hypothetical protein [Croceivirga radicis]